MMIGSSEIPDQAQRAPRMAAAASICASKACARKTTGDIEPSTPCRSRFAPVRSSASPASPATARSSSWRCWPGNASPPQEASHVHGEAYRPTRAEMLRHKVSCLPEEPLRNACVPGMSVAENLVSRKFDQPAFTVARVFLNRRAMRSFATDLIARYRIKASSPEAAGENAIRRQRAAHGARTRAVRGDRGAGRRESVLRTRLRSDLGHPVSADAGAQSRRRDLAGERGPR